MKYAQMWEELKAVIREGVDDDAEFPSVRYLNKMEELEEEYE